MKKTLCCHILICLCALGWLPARGAPADAHAVFQALAARVSAMQDYIMVYDFTDYAQNKTWRFEYHCARQTPPRILTCILAGPDAGTDLLYDRSSSQDRIRVKRGIFHIWQPVHGLHLSKTPMVHSLLDMLIKELSGYPKVHLTPSGGNLVLNFERGTIRDVLALQKNTLTPLWRRKSSAGQPVISCVIDSLRVNTGQKVDLP
ncbi:MAG: hypothetical protein ACYCW6_31410 [Candidatus Xenobia bacterium]